jgi:hypothetical protein
MARIRTIKPEFFRHEGLQDLETTKPGLHVMLVFAALWGHCDSNGRFEWRPRQLKLDILPFLDFDIGQTLGALEGAGFVRRYEVGGKAYGEIGSFEKHQRLTGKEASQGVRFPGPGSEAPEKQEGSDGETSGKDSAPANVLKIHGQQRGSTREAPGKHPDAQERGREGKEEGNTPSGAQAPDLEKICFDTGKALLGQKAGGVIAKLKAKAGGWGQTLDLLEKAKTKQDPMEWVNAVIRGRFDNDGWDPFVDPYKGAL